MNKLQFLSVLRKMWLLWLFVTDVGISGFYWKSVNVDNDQGATKVGIYSVSVGATTYPTHNRVTKTRRTPFRAQTTAKIRTQGCGPQEEAADGPLKARIPTNRNTGALFPSGIKATLKIQVLFQYCYSTAFWVFLTCLKPAHSIASTIFNVNYRHKQTEISIYT